MGRGGQGKGGGKGGGQRRGRRNKEKARRGQEERNHLAPRLGVSTWLKITMANLAQDYKSQLG